MINDPGIEAQMKILEAHMKRGGNRSGLKVAYFCFDSRVGEGSEYRIGIGGDKAATLVLQRALTDSQAYRRWRLIRARAAVRGWILRGWAAVTGRRVVQHQIGKSPKARPL